jgi:hypothetical protein
VYGDFSRVPDARFGRYTAVLAQQGRLLLDAELNEQSAILLEYVRRLATDLMGPFAGPAHRCGFGVELVVDNGKCSAVKLARGGYYVYGLRCESAEPDEPARVQVKFTEPREAPFVVYLTVWEQSVSAIQDPALAEPALGPAAADTSRRSQVRWSVRAGKRLPGSERDLTGLERAEIIRAFHRHNTDAHRRPRLSARAHATSAPDPAPSTLPAAAGYRGIENQLYRVEVHRAGNAEEATFKWSRDNGSVELAVSSLTMIDDAGVRTASVPDGWRDARRGLEAGDWVELVDDHWRPLGPAAPLMRVRGVSMAKREVTLEDADSRRAFHAGRHPFLRRWDQAPDIAAPNHGIPVSEAQGGWFELEDGVQVQFEDSAAHFEHGDFWLIPSRTATHDVLWPIAEGNEEGDSAGPKLVPPEGPARHLAPLALVSSLDSDPEDLRIHYAAWPDELLGDDDDVGDISDQAPVTMIRAPAPKYRLVSVAAVSAGATFDLSEGVMIAGRKPGDRGIHLDHPVLSRQHAVFALDGDHLTVEDLKSANGTWVNDERIATSTPVELALDDVVTLGSEDVKLQVQRP